MTECRCEHALGRRAVRKCALRRLALRRSARARAGRGSARDSGHSRHTGITGVPSELWLSNHAGSLYAAVRAVATWTSSLWRDLRSALPRHRGPMPSSECATAKQQSREHGEEGSEYDRCHAYLLSPAFPRLESHGKMPIAS